MKINNFILEIYIDAIISIIKSYVRKYDKEGRIRIEEIKITKKGNLIEWTGMKTRGISNTIAEARRQIKETAKLRFGILSKNKKILFILIPSLKLLNILNPFKYKKVVEDIKKNWYGNTALPNGEIVIKYISAIGTFKESWNEAKRHINKILYLECEKRC